MYLMRTKILLLGDKGVGKTSLVNRWTGKRQTADPTVGIEVTSHMIQIQNNIHRVRLSDTSGKDCYRTLLDTYIVSTNVVVIVYDVTSKPSLDVAITWVKHATSILNEIPIYLVGNKIDRESKRTVYPETVRHMLSEWSFDIMIHECSAATGEKARDLYSSILLNQGVIDSEIWTTYVPRTDSQSSCVCV